MELIKKLKKKYDGKSINEIEAEIFEVRASINEGQIRKIELLYYLDSTKRFRDNKQYAKATFETYLQDHFNIRPHTYQKERYAVLGYRGEVEEYGVGLVAKVRDKCTKPDVVFQEIKEIEKTRKTPTPRGKIEEVIQNHLKPIPPKKETPLLKHPEIEVRMEQIQEMGKKIETKDEQIAKLKKAVEKWKAEAERWKQKYERLASLIRPVVAPLTGLNRKLEKELRV